MMFEVKPVDLGRFVVIDLSINCIIYGVHLGIKFSSVEYGDAFFLLQNCTIYIF